MPLSLLMALFSVLGGRSALVDPFVGATTTGGPDSSGLGKTFPGAVAPFGMVQLSPDTIVGGANESGYSRNHRSIDGFSFTHLSGVGWYGDLGNLLVTPTTGPLATNSGREAEGIEGYRSPFRTGTEVATPGYYAVTLDKYGVRAEAAAAPHSGILRFAYPKNAASRIQIDLAHRIGGTSTEQWAEMVDDRTIRGWMRCTPEGGGIGDGAGNDRYVVYFYGRFSKPLKSYGFWSAEPPAGQRLGLAWAGSVAFQDWARNATRLPMARAAHGAHLGFYGEFPTKQNEKVSFKAGISFSSVEGAQANLNAEIPDWNFEKAWGRTHGLWEDALGKVSVEGGTREARSIFATALYHSMIDPRTVTDVTGEHPSADGRTRIDPGFTYRSVFSGWDVFRSQFPLQTLINPRVVNDDVNSLVQMADLSGRGVYPRWEFLNADTTSMVGNPAISVVADAFRKGIRDFPIGRAYDLAVATSERFGNGPDGYVPLDRDGYTEGSLSQTLEYGYTEWCVSQLASWLGKPGDAALYGARSQAYRRTFDPSVGWFRARFANGDWAKWPETGKLSWIGWCTESNPLQQGWFVPHDPEGLATLLGGSDAASAQLEDLFEATPQSMAWNPYYNHANEVVHHAPFLFNAWGKPWLTQKWAHEIGSRAYATGVEGLRGNDDEGQMSAWFVLASIGFHPLCPGDGRYEICGPRFDKVTIRLDPRYASGRTFVVKAKRESKDDFYIQSATLNGQPFDRSWIGHDEVARGGVLAFRMGPRPNPAWGVR